MPVLSVWIAAAAVSASIPILWWALASDRTVTRRATDNLGDPRIATQRAMVLDQAASIRIAGPLLRQFGSRAMRFTPFGWLRGVEEKLGRAGLLGTFTPEQVLGSKILLSMGLGLFALMQVLGGPSRTTILMLIGFVLFGFFAPDLFLRMRGDRRVEEITLALPDLLDQLTISVEAGLGFEAALNEIIRRDPKQPLSLEFGRTLQDIQLGMRRSEALADLSKRAAVPDLRHVILALRQAEQLGVPLAQTLRVQALEMREKRRFRAEERANRLPIQMIFPLGFCIFPALFIVILGPAAIRLSQTF